MSWIEGRCAFQRWPNLALAVGEPEIIWRRRPGIRAINRLPVVARQETQRLAAQEVVVRCGAGARNGAAAPRLLPRRNTQRRFNRHRSKLLRAPLFGHTPP